MLKIASTQNFATILELCKTTFNETETTKYYKRSKFKFLKKLWCYVGGLRGGEGRGGEGRGGEGRGGESAV